MYYCLCDQRHNNRAQDGVNEEIQGIAETDFSVVPAIVSKLEQVWAGRVRDRYKSFIFKGFNTVQRF